MGFFEKVKNLFTEEVEDDDVKVEQIKKEVTHVQIESPSVKNEDEEELTPIKEENKPVFFDDNDFKDLNLIDEPKEEKEEIIKDKDIYGSKIKVEPDPTSKKTFKPTPIISPVYGILDKNYHKEDIVSRHDTTSEVKPSSIDAVRNKAYGTLEDELENTLFGSNSILFKKDKEDDQKLQVKEVDDEVLTDLTDDISKELDDLLEKKEKLVEELDKNKADISDKEEDLLGFIDSTLYKDGDEE